MDNKFLMGLVGATGANIAWNMIPGNEQFTMQLKKMTSVTGLAEKSPLAFIEHHHYGLASIIAGLLSPKKYSPYLYGFGTGMISSELFQNNPFGIGKTEQEVQGNMALTIILGALLLGSL